MENKIELKRGGDKVKLEKESRVFTAVIKSNQDLEKIKNIPGVQRVRAVDRKICKVYVDEAGVDEPMKRLRSKELNGVCHHAYRPRNSEGTRYYLTDELIVKFDPAVSDNEIATLLTGKKLKILREFNSAEKIYLVQVTTDTGMNPLKVAAALSDERSVIYAEPNLVNRFARFYTPQDSYFSRQWHLKSTPAADVAHDADISAIRAWDISMGSRKVVIAILDDGFDLSHPDFNGDGKVVFAKDFVDGDGFPFPGGGDYHGTPCAGVAIAEENGFGVVGVAPRCAFMPVRFPLAADDNLLYQIFDYAGRNADVISCSWGPPPVEAPLPQLLKDKFSQLADSGGSRGKGCVIVFAAGNHNAPVFAPHNTGFEWRDYKGRIQNTTGPIINGFAANPDVLAISASSSLNQKALYSNWGDEIAVCAPSDNFDPMAGPGQFVLGRGVCTTDNEAYGDGFTSDSQFTEKFGGTSSAAPVVAGVAGLVISANMELTAKQARNIIISTADPLSDPSTSKKWSGSGKVNAHKAVLEAKNGAGSMPVEPEQISSLAQRVIKKLSAARFEIPDNVSPGIDSIIKVDEDAPLARVEVAVDIEHPFIGDLFITLKSPDGTTVILHNNTGGGKMNLTQVFNSEQYSELKLYENKSTQGDWVLSVEDRALNDFGVLNEWGLKLTLAS